MSRTAIGCGQWVTLPAFHRSGSWCFATGTRDFAVNDIAYHREQSHILIDDDDNARLSVGAHNITGLVDTQDDRGKSAKSSAMNKDVCEIALAIYEVRSYQPISSSARNKSHASFLGFDVGGAALGSPPY